MSSSSHVYPSRPRTSTVPSTHPAPAVLEREPVRVDWNELSPTSRYSRSMLSAMRAPATPSVATTGSGSGVGPLPGHAGRTALLPVLSADKSRSLLAQVEAPPAAPSWGGRRWLAGATFFVAATAAVLALGRKVLPFEVPAPRLAAPAALAWATPAAPKVVVAPAEMLPAGRALSLVGEVRPAKQVLVYAKIGGYLKEVRFDKGDRVRAGQILGVLENPDADGRIASAQAEVGLRTSAAKRTRTLTESGAVPAAENEKPDAELAIANAELGRAYATKGYAILRSPFSGTVTARYADPGALLQSAAGSAPSSLPLAEISDLSAVRVAFFVGQADAPYVKDGTAVKVWFDDPTRKTDARITRTTHALDPRTRTMQCEIDLPNKDGAFTAGSSVHVELLAATPPALAVPAEAVFLVQGKSMVTVVRDGIASRTAVETGDHDGKRVRILRGVADGDLVALNAGHEVASGAKVEAVRKDRPAEKVAGALMR